VPVLSALGPSGRVHNEPNRWVALNLLSLGAELAGFGLAIAFSPLHIALLLLLLLGPDPLRRGGLFVAAWLLTSVLELALMLSLGHGLVLPMEKGSQHRTGLDLLAAGALLALGLRELLNAGEEGESPAWSRRLAGFGALPLLPLLGLSSLVQVVSPDDLFLYAKASGNLLAAGLDRSREWLVGGLFTLSTALLLLVPLLAMAVLGRERLIPGLEGGKSWLLRNADPLVGLVSLALAVYLGWQGIEGLRLG
jgi:hypothetical protein